MLKKRIHCVFNAAMVNSASFVLPILGWQCSHPSLSGQQRQDRTTEPSPSDIMYKEEVHSSVVLRAHEVLVRSTGILFNILNGCY